MNPKDYIIPTRLELILYLVVSALITFVANFNYLVIYLLNETGNVPLLSEGLTSIYTTRLLNLIESFTFVPFASVFIFWSLAGLAVFTILQSFYSVWAELKTDVNVTTRFVRPASFVSWKFWGGVFLQFVAHVSLYAVLIILTYLLAFILTPLAAVFTRLFFTLPTLSGFVSFISFFGLLYFGVLLVALILKLFFRRKRLAT